MDVLGSLCVWLGSSTAQLRESLGSRRACTCSEAGFSSQNGDRAWGVYYQRSAFCCACLCAKWFNTRIFIKKCFLFNVGSVCRVKRFTAGWQTFRWWREVVETEVRKWLRLPCCGFRRTGINVGGGICREINVSSSFEYQMFYVVCPFVTSLLTLPRM
jgi:hypothetical protein